MTHRPHRWFIATAALLLTLFVSLVAQAHKPSDSYLTISVDGAKLEGRWDIALRDLAYAKGIDSDGDGKITWREVDEHYPDVATYAKSRLTIPGCPITMRLGERGVASHSDGTYAILTFEADCSRAPGHLDIEYRLFFDVDAQHRGLLRLELPGKSMTHVFSLKEPRARFDLGTAGAGRQLGVITKEGILHIWTGYDHVLFLLALLLPSVLRRDPKTKRWIPTPSLKIALLDVLRIVTAFTVAHSMTLSLAALGVVALPSRLVESAIAASVVLAALNNLYPLLREDRWIAAFLLGLMHGFGFSSTLMDLDLPRSNLVLTLFGFNLGVEMGQVAIVGVFVPLAYAVRSTNVYRRGMLAAGSAGILALSAIWLVERAFVVKILP